MKHDDQYAFSIFTDNSTCSIDAGHACLEENESIDAMKEYHEHMSRLRSVDESPNDGDSIAALRSSGSASCFKWSSKHDEFSRSTVGWFLLPEVFKL